MPVRWAQHKLRIDVQLQRRQPKTILTLLTAAPNVTTLPECVHLLRNNQMD